MKRIGQMLLVKSQKRLESVYKSFVRNILKKIGNLTSGGERPRKRRNQRKREKDSIFQEKIGHCFHFPRKNRALFVVAATMVFVLGIGMTSLGGRPYWLKVADLVLGNENTVKVNTEGEDRIETTKVDEKEAWICQF